MEKNQNLFKPLSSLVLPEKPTFETSFYFKATTGAGFPGKYYVNIYKEIVVINAVLLSEYDLSVEGYSLLKTYKGKGFWVKQMVLKVSSFETIAGCFFNHIYESKKQA